MITVVKFDDESSETFSECTPQVDELGEVTVCDSDMSVVAILGPDEWSEITVRKE